MCLKASGHHRGTSSSAAGTSLMETYGVSREMAEVLPTNRHSRSTKLNYQKYVNDLDELLARCEEQKEAFFQKAVASAARPNATTDAKAMFPCTAGA